MTPPGIPPAAAGPGSAAAPPAPHPRLHDSKPGEGLRDLSSRPGLKKRPPAETVPPEPVIFDPEKKARADAGPPDFEGAARREFQRTLASNTAVLAFLGGQVLTGLPAVQAWRRTGIIPTTELLLATGISLAFALLVFSRKVPLKILAGILGGLNVLGAMAGVVLWLAAPHFPLLAELGTSLPPPGIALGAVGLFFAATLLLTGPGPVRFTIAALGIIAGIGLPFLPAETFALLGGGPEAGAAKPGTPAGGSGESAAPRPESEQIVLATAADLVVPVPKGWKQIESRADGTRVFRSPDATLMLRAVPGPELGEDKEKIRQFVKEQIERLRREFPGQGEMQVAIEGHPEARKRVLLSSPDRAEILFVRQSGRLLMLVVSGREDAFSVHRADVDALFEKALSQSAEQRDE